jgi:hypothetical protein
MAAPNIVNLSNISPHTATITGTTVMSNVIVNGPSTSTSCRLNTILLSNFSGNIVQANVILNRSGAVFYLAGNMSIPTYSTMVLLAKDTLLYIEENDSLQANTSANSAITVTASYELIS